MQQTVTVQIAVPLDAVHAYVRDVHNLPGWSFFTSAEPEGDHWRVSSAEGTATLRFLEPDERGVLDHVVDTDSGLHVEVPMRVAPHPGGSEVSLVVDAPADRLDEDVATVTADLARLKALLEADAPSMRDRMLAGEAYVADDPQLVADSLRAMTLTEQFNATPAASRDVRRQLLVELLGEFGPDSEVRPPFHCDYGFQTSIGARTFVNFGLVVLDVARVSIGDDVQIGPRVQLLTATHPLEPGPRRDKWESAAPIVIGDNVWLGGGVIVCPGVTIGANTVVGAGSVVTKDLPAGVLAVGTPAWVVRSLV